MQSAGMDAFGSLGLDPRALHDAAPEDHLLANPPLHVGRAANLNQGAGSVALLAQSGLGSSRLQRGIEALDHAGWRALRRDEAGPDTVLDAWMAASGQGRHLGHQRQPSCAGDGQSDELSAADEAGRIGDANKLLSCLRGSEGRPSA